MPPEDTNDHAFNELTKSLMHEAMGESFVPTQTLHDGTLIYRLQHLALTVKRTGFVLHLEIGPKDTLDFDVVRDGNIEAVGHWIQEVQLCHDAEDGLLRLVKRMLDRQQNAGKRQMDAHLRSLRNN